MSLNEIFSIAIFAMLLINGVMFRFAWHYRDKSKQLVRQIAKLQIQISNIKEEVREKDIKFSREIKQTIDECGAKLKELNQKIDEYEEAFKRKNEIISCLKAEVESRYLEIEKFKDELKQRDEKIKNLKQAHKEAIQKKDIALHRRFKEVEARDAEIEKLKEELKLNSKDEKEVQSRDEEIDELKRKLDAYDETFGKNIKSMYELIAEIAHRDKEIERLEDELKQRDASIQKPPVKELSKKKSK
ncbi:hypothetical protein [Bartonella saheliensis]|uniref:hypothetical protein n=1 Tax=Bartonella saheliensis TaxID=1457016 RepID=UPI0011A737B9|nr:hypothetical protein [Bartonella saheliensis]